ncbi:hypothetical protein [Maledivibacter halophilus]|uniref:Phage tail tube protein n=1 Tax=Maledivibacter halophilus TaxID=36842 RepID=A0A1T5M4F5_9FIRM|nr:hypothetical protein [Maledivibacter halophilus]SKC82914.1 hypothetical protein SAMN02194393_03776 [Maledivibacter halophilus]
MDIFLSINNRQQVIKLPVLPAEFKIQSGMKNETYDVISQGEIKLIGMPTLKSISLQSFFPNRDYSFLRNKEYKGWEYVEAIEKWKEERVPIRLIISEASRDIINMPCSIESFEYGLQDGTGDIYYTITLSEFKFIELDQRGI